MFSMSMIAVVDDHAEPRRRNRARIHRC